MADPVVTDDRGASDTTTVDDPFVSAFKEAAGKEDEPAQAEERDAKDEKADEEEPVKAEKKDEKKEEKKDEETPEQRYRTLQGIHKHDVETFKAEKAELLKQLEEAKAAPKKDAKEDKKDEKKDEATEDDLTPEQKAQLAEYEQDFDLVSRMEGIKRDRAFSKLLKEFTSFKETLLAEIATAKKDAEEAKKLAAPVPKIAEKNEREEHFRIVSEGYTAEDGTEVPGHPDYEQHTEAVKAWIEEQPKIFQPELKRICASGSAMEVIELLTLFKTDKGISEAPDETGGNVVRLTKAEKKAALSRVNTRKPSVNAQVASADDYRAAFKEASRKAGG